MSRTKLELMKIYGVPPAGVPDIIMAPPGRQGSVNRNDKSRGISGRPLHNGDNAPPSERGDLRQNPSRTCVCMFSKISRKAPPQSFSPGRVKSPWDRRVLLAGRGSGKRDAYLSADGGWELRADPTRPRRETEFPHGLAFPNPQFGNEDGFHALEARSAGENCRVRRIRSRSLHRNTRGPLCASAGKDFKDPPLLDSGPIKPDQSGRMNSEEARRNSRVGRGVPPGPSEFQTRS